MDEFDVGGRLLTIPPTQLDEALDILEASIEAAAMKQAA